MFTGTEGTSVDWCFSFSFFSLSLFQVEGNLGCNFVQPFKINFFDTQAHPERFKAMQNWVNCKERERKKTTWYSNFHQAFYHHLFYISNNYFLRAVSNFQALLKQENNISSCKCLFTCATSFTFKVQHERFQHLCCEFVSPWRWGLMSKNVTQPGRTWILSQRTQTRKGGDAGRYRY